MDHPTAAERAGEFAHAVVDAGKGRYAAGSLAAEDVRSVVVSFRAFAEHGITGQHTAAFAGADDLVPFRFQGQLHAESFLSRVHLRHADCPEPGSADRTRRRCSGRRPAPRTQSHRHCLIRHSPTLDHFLTGQSIMTMTSKFRGTCVSCGQPIAKGAQIEWSRATGAKHLTCATSAASSQSDADYQFRGHLGCHDPR